MTSDPATAVPTTPVAELGALMKDHQCRHIPIVDGDRLVGIVSTKDLMRAGKTAADVMTRSPAAIAPNERLEVAAAMMALKKLGCLLVVDGEDLVGIITTFDILDAFARDTRTSRT